MRARPGIHPYPSSSNDHFETPLHHPTHIRPSAWDPSIQIQMRIILDQLLQLKRLGVLLPLRHRNRPMALHHLRHLRTRIHLIHVDHALEQRCFRRPHAPAYNPEQRICEVVVLALRVNPFGDEHEGRAEDFELGRWGVLVDEVDAVVGGEREGLYEEGVHGVEAVAEVVEADDGLEVFGGVVDDAAGGEAAVEVVAI